MTTSRHFHFIGIGGAGMSGIARILLSQGHQVSGSDQKSSMVTDQLVALGATIYKGHEAHHQDGSDVLVVSTAIHEDNVELVAAKQRGALIMHRAEALAYVMQNQKALAVAGTHGKTTTTSMLTVALQTANLDPSFSIGGMINATGSNAHFGSGEYFVAEADESDGSFLAYSPFAGIITNIELDHVDHFATEAEIDRIFIEFSKRFDADGHLIVCGDDAGVQRLLPSFSIKPNTYGKNQSNDYRIDSIELGALSGKARVLHKGKSIAQLELSVPGEHNLLNALAVVALTHELGISLPAIIHGLAAFTGSRRRFEIKGEVQGIRVVDDYGHHPTEISVTLQAARRYAGSGRVITIFQPHRFSRTQQFAREFTQALKNSDLVYLLDIYAASEKEIPGVSSELIVQAGDERFIYQPSMISVVESVASLAEPGDVILTMGAGDVTALAPAIVTALSERFA